MGVKITIVIGQWDIAAELDPDLAPATCHAALSHMPLHTKCVGARWSGPLILVQKLPWHDLKLENPSQMLSAGDIVFHPAHRDLAIAYEATQFIEQTRAVYVTYFGRVTDNLTHLILAGARMQRSGAIDCTWMRTG